ncbi:MAG: TonB family protein [Duncaniella sp.]|nr:TonB family protein [Duncaniella sp.]
MPRGKYTCKILKEIRRQIAEANDIEFITSECQHKGDCLGTCPKCEAEVRYLDRQLRSRSLSGKAVAIAGISAGMLLMNGCASRSLQSEPNTTAIELSDEISIDEIEGEIDALDMSPQVNEETVQPEEITVRMGMTEECIVNEEEVTDSDEFLYIVGDTRPDSIKRPDYPNGNAEEVTEKIYDVAEKKAAFPGGDKALTEYLSKNIRYPQALPDNINGGTVIVKFVIDRNGKAKDPTVIKGVHPTLDREAQRVIFTLPTFSPAMYDGHPVSSYYTVPVTFTGK